MIYYDINGNFFESTEYVLFKIKIDSQQKFTIIQNYIMYVQNKCKVADSPLIIV